MNVQEAPSVLIPAKRTKPKELRPPVTSYPIFLMPGTPSNLPPPLLSVLCSPGSHPALSAKRLSPSFLGCHEARHTLDSAVVSHICSGIAD